MAKKRKSTGKTALMRVTRYHVRAMGMDFSEGGCPFALKGAATKKAGKKK
jgi:hypothetical protein